MATNLPAVLIEPRSADDSEVAALVVDQQAEIRVRDGGLPDQATVVNRAARYVVALLDGEAVGMGALQALDVDAAEVKRMYVRPQFRGRGIARHVLDALERLAVIRGHVIVRLETAVYLPEAIALYLGAGYRPIARFGEYQRNEYSRCFERRVDGTEPDVRVTRRRSDDPAVMMLTKAAVAELDERYDGQDAGYKVDPAARFVLACVGGAPVGCGAIQPIDDQTVEVKRMYVLPGHRGRGLARRMLAALEDLAAGTHYPLVRLETGNRQPEAVGLYRSAGYREIPAYGQYSNDPFSICFEKTLIATAAPEG